MDKKNGESSGTNIVRFNGENWTLWKFQIEITLKSKGYYGIVGGTITKPATNATEWENKDAKAQELIVWRLDDKTITYIVTCETSHISYLKSKKLKET